LLASMRVVWGLKNCQMTYKPGSVPTAEAVDDGYSSRMAVASHLKQPTRTSVQDRTCCKRQRMSLHGLAPDGVYHARSVTSSAVRSYRTFSPLPAHQFSASGGLFSVALSLGLPPPGVTRHPDPVEPGLSSPFAETKAAAIRSSDRSGLYAGDTSVVKQAPWPAFREFRSWQSLRLFQRRSTRRLPFQLFRFARPPVDQPTW
jgi:hypothetical protein